MTLNLAEAIISKSFFWVGFHDSIYKAAQFLGYLLARIRELVFPFFAL